MKDMELIKITESDTLRRLRESPEAGMGYQFGERSLRLSRRKTRGVFLAGNYFYAFGFEEANGAGDEPNLSKAMLLEAVQPISQQAPLHLFEVKAAPTGLAAVAAGIATAAGATGSMPPFVTRTNQGEKFYRFSPFALDRRILSNGSLAPQSYATSDTDITVVPNGLAAVGRYALPTRTSAKYVFEITPTAGTLILFGTVTPAFGLAGGGVEVFFPNGTQPNTVKAINPLPEK